MGDTYTPNVGDWRVVADDAWPMVDLVVNAAIISLGK